MTLTTDILREPSQIPIEEFENCNAFLDRPLGTPFDVMYTYGVLFCIGADIPITTLGNDIGDEMDVVNDLTIGQTLKTVASATSDDEDPLVVTVDLDVSGDEPSFTGVDRKQFRTELLTKLYHSAYHAGNKHDNSLTDRIRIDGRAAGDVMDKDMSSCFDWVCQGVNTDDDELETSELLVSEAIKECSDGDVLEKFATFSFDLEEGSDLYNKIESQLTDIADDTTYGFVTVRFRTETDGEFKWPGEIEAIRHATRVHKQENYTAGSDGKEDVSPDMPCGILGDVDGAVVGGYNGPLFRSGAKQEGLFWRFKQDAAWRNHAVSLTAAGFIENSRQFVHACSRLYGGDMSLYTLPYFDFLTPERARVLYAILYDVYTSDKPVPLVKTLRRTRENDVNVSIYQALLKKPHATTYVVLDSEFGISLSGYDQLIQAYTDFADSWVYNDALPTSDESSNWLDNPEFITERVSGPWFGKNAVPKSWVTAGMDDDQAKRDVLSEDSEPIFSVIREAALGLGSVTDDYLYRAFEKKWREIDGEKFTYTADGEQSNGVNFDFAETLISQFALFTVLHKQGTLKTRQSTTSENTNENCESEGFKFERFIENPVSDDQAESSDLSRREKLDNFLDTAPALDHPERRSAFLVGVLVGRVSGYQDGYLDLGQTLAAQYDAPDMNPHILQRVATKALDKIVTYAHTADERKQIFYTETVEEAVTALAERDPNDYNLTARELKFWYALGVSYGITDQTPHSTDSEEDSESDEETESNTQQSDTTTDGEQ